MSWTWTSPSTITSAAAMSDALAVIALLESDIPGCLASLVAEWVVGCVRLLGLPEAAASLRSGGSFRVLCLPVGS